MTLRHILAVHLPLCYTSIYFLVDLCSVSQKLLVSAISHRCGCVLASSSGQTTLITFFFPGKFQQVLCAPDDILHCIVICISFYCRNKKPLFRAPIRNRTTPNNNNNNNNSQTVATAQLFSQQPRQPFSQHVPRRGQQETWQSPAPQLPGEDMFCPGVDTPTSMLLPGK